MPHGVRERFHREKNVLKHCLIKDTKYIENTTISID